MSSLNFSKFFEAVHGVQPLPWQSALAARLLAQHSWPDLIDLPTASGKTACIDIAVFHLAACAERGEPWRAARRVVFVVDRRIIVDAAFERAKKLSAALETGTEPAITCVRAALLRLGSECALACQKLRGGMPRERGFALDPAQPMVVTSTIDQIGSRLLFRGYGLSPYSHPLHAGLLSHDTLILLDEAHLGVPFLETVKAIRREQARAERPLGPIQPVRVISLSATATSDGERFQLSAADLRNKLLQARRTAPKPARLVNSTTKPAEHIKLLLEEALKIYKGIEGLSPAIAVIVNRVKTARALFDELRAKVSKDTDIKLMIGRSRPLDREEVSRFLLSRAAAGRTPCHGERGLIVVATQTIEVGADLDFQGVLTECASLDALRQRFGRLDRLGTYRRSRAVIVGGWTPDNDPIYGAALNRTWRWLHEIAISNDGDPTVEFSIEAMESATKAIDVHQLSSDPREQLCLTPTHVQLLCQTSPPPMYAPDINALLHGLQSEQADVQIVWRAHISAVRDQGANGAFDAKVVNTLLTLLPPTSLETLALPISSVRAWLTEQSVRDELADLEGAREDDEEVRPARRPPARHVWRRAGESWELVSVGSVRPGDTIVVPSSFGGCDEFGFAPKSHDPVTDLSEKARQALKCERIVVLTEAQLRQQLGPDRIDDARAAWAAVEDAYRSLQCEPHELLQVLLEKLDFASAIELASIDTPIVETLVLSNQVLYGLILRTGKAGTEDMSDEDLSSSLTVPVLLDDHNRAVGSRARSLARSVALEPDLVETAGCAGDLHDLGKADPRFQRLLRAGDNVTSLGNLLAKGLRRRHHQRIELGERHEAYSVAMLKCFPNLLTVAPDAELAIYLVGTHHGRGRALMPFKSDDGVRFKVKVANGETLEFEGAPFLGELGSGWPALFWKLVERYGAWGLAYLESVLRLADHLQSRDEMKRES